MSINPQISHKFKALLVVTFLLSPFTQAQASTANTTTNITYSNVSLSALNTDISGSFSKSKIPLPSSVSTDGTGNAYVHEIEGILVAYQIPQSEIWIDSKNNFVKRDPKTNKVVLVEKTKTNGEADFKTIKKGLFQGSKNSLTLISKAVKKDVTILGDNSPGSHVEVYRILAYDSDSQSTIGIMLVAPLKFSITTQKIWNTILKSIEVKSNKSFEKTKKSVSNALNTIPYTGKYYSIKLPSNWSIETDGSDVTAMAPNIGATIVASAEKSDELPEYDPELRSFWSNAFVSEYKNEFENFKFISSSDATIDGLPALRIDYKAKIEGINFEIYQIVTMKDKIQYILTAMVTNKNQWKNYKTIIEKSFATFKRINGDAEKFGMFF